MLTAEIKGKVQSLWDRLWAGGLANPITAIEQISYLLFMKRLENFKNNPPSKYKWSSYHSESGEKLIVLLPKIFEYIKTELADKDEPFAKAMKDAVFLINTPSLLKDAINFIDDIYKEIEKQEKDDNQYFQDIQGDVYEYLLRHTSEAGKNGQFRTPRHIIQLMAELLKPDVDGKICDLACGSSGFLVGAYQYVITKYSKKVVKDNNGLSKGVDGGKLTKKQKVDLKENTFYGFDIDQTMVRIGMMNLMMHGITHPNIEHIDTLSLRYEALEAKRLKEPNTDNEDSFDKPKTNSKRKKENWWLNPKLRGQYKYILANPPFTGKINSATISDNLTRIYSKDKKTVQSELLFLERMIYMLEEGGKACVIVPEGVLFNSSSAHVSTRKLLMYDCNLKGIVSLPAGVFQPYTGVKTSILLFEKRKYNSDIPITTNVWFYEMKSDGYSLDSNRKKLKENPLPIIINKWNEWDKTKIPQENKKLQYFNIPFDEIEKNKFELNLNRYKEFEYVAEEYRAPMEILTELNELEEEILKGLKRLEVDE